MPTYYTEGDSGFLSGPETRPAAPAMTLLHCSASGQSMLYRTEKFGQFIVLKCLRPEYRDNPIWQALLRKEFEIGYGLSHPNICKTLGFVTHPELGACIEMEWIDGNTLAERFTGGSLPSEETFLKIASQLCDILDYLHSKQIVHKDIKLSNLMLTHSGDNLRLVDFGLADSDSWAELKGPAGTANYMAPEVADGGIPDFRSDMWSAGAVLSQLTKGHRRALGRCLSANPAARPSSGAALLSALRRKSPVPWIIAALIVAAITFALWYIPAGQEKEQPAAEVSAPAREEVLPGVPEPAASTPAPQTKKAPKPRAESPKATEKDIDELWKQATEMIEDK